ncbi:MAG: hypothetical protein IPL03_10560 [Sterolibacteriaceae bacterium]|nr:hypothetical protein [Candidatus Methylophosphatis haderslevensis]
MRYAWIEANIDSYSVTMMCDLLSVSRSGLHDARRRGPSARALEEAQIVTWIRRAQLKHRGRYGRRRMTTELVEEPAGRSITSALDGSCERMILPVASVVGFAW